VSGPRDAGEVDAGETHAGDLAIVLHSHMPYVEGFGTYPFGEEWLFDAVIRSYIPLLPKVADLTMTVTPVLADQLEAPGLAERLLEFTRSFRVESARLDEKDMEEPALRAACAAEAERYEAVLSELERRDGDVIGAFAEAKAARGVELIPSSATHAVLPLLATREAVLMQLETGLRSHTRRFGRARGFWLPECAYEPGLEHLLDAAGIGWTCVDQSAHEPPGSAMVPISAGPITAFPIDWEAVQWLWSMEGYPSDPLYADFHRKSLRGCRPWAISGEPYDADAAAARAREQAEEFARDVGARLRAHRDRAGAPGLLTFAIDTELLGHWWWEGPTWLAEVLERLPEHGVRPVRLSDALEEHPTEPRPLRRSSWGEDKDLRTWDSRPVADLVRGARRLELRLLREVGAGLDRPAAERAARELLAVQASDWAFLDYRRQAGDYPFLRVLDHSRSLFEAINSGSEQTEPALRNLAPDLALATLQEP
jgi:1,4-alpha-glucan branching enzyme